MKHHASALLIVAALLAPPCQAQAQAPADERRAPKLVLQLTVDQLRGDLLERYKHRMGPDGFRRLLDHGVVYRDAHHAHANTETIVGHTTLATGAHPATHGMIGNVWLDRAAGRLAYNVEDAEFPLLSADGDVDQATEIDPTQKKANSSGRSPANIRVSTFGDELAVASAGGAKVFGVSVKDRGAISMAGHAGKAYWFSKAAGGFVTSRYYAERYPEWVTAWNAAAPAQRYAGKAWELLHEPASYLYGARDDQPWEQDLKGYGRVFPHAFGPGDGKYFTTLLTISPAGDQLTADFAKALLEHEALGQDEVTDYLSVSFSSTDYVGHFFGPSSLESEDNLLQLDRTLADLLAVVDARVGLDRTLVVLSADHGAPEAAGALQALGIEAHLVRPKQWDKQPGLTALEERFGVGESLIEEFFPPYVYLDHAVVRERGLDLEQVAAAVAAEITKLPGVEVALPSQAIERGLLPDTLVSRAVLRNHDPARSGDIYVVFAPHSFLAEIDGLPVAALHGSPWSYDTFVPIVFAGCGLQPRQVFRRVHTVDVAPTLSSWLGIKPPSGAAGEPLVEVLDQR